MTSFFKTPSENPPIWPLSDFLHLRRLLDWCSWRLHGLAKTSISDSLAVWLGKLPASPGASVVLRTGLRTTSAMEKNTSYNPYQKGGEKTRHKHTVIRNSIRNSIKQPCRKNWSTPRPPECLRRSDLAFPQPSRCWWLLCKWFTVYNPHVAADIP